jgi:hypothetical protein
MAMLAYLDAGTGSLIATVVVGGTAAAGVAVRSARAKVTGALTRKRKGGSPEASASPAPPAAQAEATAEASGADGATGTPTGG